MYIYIYIKYFLFNDVANYFPRYLHTSLLKKKKKKKVIYVNLSDI